MMINFNDKLKRLIIISYIILLIAKRFHCYLLDTGNINENKNCI